MQCIPSVIEWAFCAVLPSPLVVTVDELLIFWQRMHSDSRFGSCGFYLLVLQLLTAELHKEVSVAALFVKVALEDVQVVDRLRSDYWLLNAVWVS